MRARIDPAIRGIVTAHDIFVGWLFKGAKGQPPLRAARHAMRCRDCLQLVSAFDGLNAIDLTRAIAGPPPTPEPRGLFEDSLRFGLGGGLVAIALLIFVVFFAQQTQPPYVGAVPPSVTETHVEPADLTRVFAGVGEVVVNATPMPSPGASTEATSAPEPAAGGEIAVTEVVSNPAPAIHDPRSDRDGDGEDGDHRGDGESSEDRGDGYGDDGDEWGGEDAQDRGDDEGGDGDGDHGEDADDDED